MVVSSSPTSGSTPSVEPTKKERKERKKHDFIFIKKNVSSKTTQGSL